MDGPRRAIQDGCERGWRRTGRSRWWQVGKLVTDAQADGGVDPILGAGGTADGDRQERGEEFQVDIDAVDRRAREEVDGGALVAVDFIAESQ